jgi:hypothetical protein
MSISYFLSFADPYGNSMNLQPKVLEVQAARSVNTVGSATVRIAVDVPFDFWRRDMRVKIYRRAGSGTPYLLGNTVWLARKFIWDETTENWIIEGMADSLSIINRRIIAYTEDTLYADKIIDNGSDDPADNVMKEFIRENYGASAVDPERDLSTYLTIADDHSLGPVIEKTAAFQDTFGVLTDIVSDAQALGTNLFFDLLPINQGKWLFEVFKDKLGADRANNRPFAQFGPEYKNLADLQLIWDYSEEATFAYIGGDGEGAGRLLITQEDEVRTSKSPFNRIEIFVDGRDEVDETIMDTLGRTELNKRTPRLKLSAKALDTPQLQFGRNYFYGDLVRVTVANFVFSCLVNAFSVSYSEGKEEMDVQLTGEIAI